MVVRAASRRVPAGRECFVVKEDQKAATVGAMSVGRGAQVKVREPQREPQPCKPLEGRFYSG